MNWFKKKTVEDPITQMSPMELVTDLLVCVQLADNRLEFSEKEAWKEAMNSLFPDHQPERAEAAMRKSFSSIEKLEERQRHARMETIIALLVNYYSKDKVKKDILPEINKLIEADGIVMSSESDLFSSIEDIIEKSGSYR